MSYAPALVYPTTIASAASLSSEIVLTRAFGTVYLECGTMASGGNYFIQAATTSGGTYSRVFNLAINSSTVGINVFQIHTAASMGFVPIPNGLPFIKIESTNSIANGHSFNIVCAD